MNPWTIFVILVMWFIMPKLMKSGYFQAIDEHPKLDRNQKEIMKIRIEEGEVRREKIITIIAFSLSAYFWMS